MGHRLISSISLPKRADTRPVKCILFDRIRLKNKGGLNAGGRRGARVVLGMPVAGDRARLNNWRRAPNYDQDDRCRHHRNRRRRVHRNAQRAMVGIPVKWVHMRHLDHCQQG
jgi:hypothetical protein